MQEEVRPKADKSLGWAYRPDADTREALARGADKIRKHPELGADRPHFGANLVKASTRMGKRRSTTTRRKKVAKKVHRLKEIAARKGGSTKRTVQAAPTPSRKKTVAPAPTGKLIPLKRICEEMDLDPKATRVKLRRLISKGEIDFHDHSQRWEFTPAQAKEIRAHLG